MQGDRFQVLIGTMMMLSSMVIANCVEEVGCAMMVVEEGMGRRRRSRRRRRRSDFCIQSFGWSHLEETEIYQRKRGFIRKTLFQGDSKLFQSRIVFFLCIV
jgi:hypothetical protein